MPCPDRLSQRWIVRLWGQGNRKMVLVLDATSLGERWTILSVSVVIRSCAIPVAWKVLGGHEKGSWRPHWEGLLKYLDGCIPAECQVLVMADQGLYAEHGRFRRFVLVDGIRSCASIWGSKRAWWMKRPLTGSGAGRRCRAPIAKL